VTETNTAETTDVVAVDASPETITPKTVEEVLAELEAFKLKVRQQALKAQASQGWCDDGLNGALRELGLPEKVAYTFPVKFVTRPKPEEKDQQAVVTINDAATEEEAKSRLEGIIASDHVPDNRELVRFEVLEAKDPQEQKAGDVDSTYARHRQCETHFTGESGCSWYCTRSEDHKNDRGEGLDGGRTSKHISGNGTSVIDVELVLDSSTFFPIGTRVKLDPEARHADSAFYSRSMPETVIVTRQPSLNSMATYRVADDAMYEQNVSTRFLSAIEPETAEPETAEDSSVTSF